MNMDSLFSLHTGDCREILRLMPDNSVDSIVTDPPYELGFMGKAWDSSGIAYDVTVWRECLRVLKPGGQLLAFGGSRTYHRLACAVEDAGFEIRDQIQWVYGSGFPKSHNIGGGLGTALKPAHEPIVMARKPLTGTVADNVQTWGTGAINVDACRVETHGERPHGSGARESWRAMENRTDLQPHGTNVTPLSGRWPANLIHDGSDEVVRLFPNTGKSTGGRTVKRSGGGNVGSGKTSEASWTNDDPGYGDSGSAARFFQTCKTGDDEWLDQNLSLSSALIAGGSLSPQSVADAIARSDVVFLALPAGTRLAVLSAPSTSATASESRLLAESVIEAIQSIAPKFLREWRQLRLSPNDSHASVVATREPTGTMTITASHWMSDGSADDVTFSITPNNSEPGEAACRFRYCAKASKRDRDEGLDGFTKSSQAWFQTGNGASGKPSSIEISKGKRDPRANNHPTVKPTDLMRYLCRLVTPPGGVVLDPFAGSGSTGKAAILEGFRFIGIELEADHVAIAEARIAHALRNEE